MNSKFQLENIRELQREQMRLFDEMALGVLITDLDDRIFFANQVVCNMLGYTTEELADRDAKTLLVNDPEELARLQRHTQRHLQGVDDTYVLRMQHRDGKILWVKVFGTVIHDEEGKALGTMGLLEDITHQHEMEEILRRRNQEQADLVALQHELFKHNTMNATAEAAAAALLHKMEADFVIIMAKQGEALPTLVTKLRADVPDPQAFANHRIGECFCGLAAQERRLLFSLDLRHDERCTRRECLLAGVQSLVSLPLQVAGDLVGIATIGAFQERDFSQQADFLRAVGGEVALALQRSRQFEREQKLRQRAETMGNIARKLVSSLDLSDVLEQILTQVATIIPYDTASISIFEGEQARILACRGFDHPEKLVDHLFPAATYHNILIRKTRQPLIVDDASTDPRFVSWGVITIRGWLLIPLVVRGEVIGALSLDSFKPRFYTSEHAEIASEFAGLAAGAIENARLYQELQQATAELEARVNERTAELQQRMQAIGEINEAMLNVMEDLQSSRERLTFYAHNLERANAELESFSYSVSHDLRAPLRHIAGFAELLALDYGPQLDDTARSYIKNLQDSAAYMDRLIQGLLTFSRLGRKALDVQPIDMRLLVEEAWRTVTGGAAEQDVELILNDDLPPCVADPLLLQQVLVNLLSNALKYSSTRPQSRIEVGYTETDKGPAYFVKDNGVGFDMRYAGKLFGMFQRLHSKEEFPGVGAGLAIVQRIVNRHGGEVWAESAVGHGATFYFSLPEQPLTLETTE